MVYLITMAVVGILGTGSAASYLQEKIDRWRPQYFWFLGLIALFPVWLLRFFAILLPATKEAGDVPLPPRAILASGVALLGVIASDFLVRRMQRSSSVRSGLAFWILGVIALLPALCVTFLNF
jgi:hypothetical protein